MARKAAGGPSLQDESLTRRTLVTAGIGLIAGATIQTVLSPAAAAATAVEGASEPWLQGLTGKHRQFFDTPVAHDATPLRRTWNFLDAYAEAYHLSDQELNVIVGFHDKALPLLLGDSMWAKYSLGRRAGVTDPRTGAPAERNPFIVMSPENGWEADYSISSLQRRGVRFLACNRTIHGLARNLATERHADEASIRAEITHAVLPGVTVVPAMVVAANRAQEAGLAYTFFGT